MARIEDAPRRAVRRTRSHQTRRELVEIGFAKEHGARRDQLFDALGIAFRSIRKGWAARGRGKSRHVDIVLHGEGNAPKWLSLALPPRHQRMCPRANVVLGNARNPDRRIGIGVGTAQHFACDIRGGDSFGAIAFAQTCNIEEKIVHAATAAPMRASTWPGFTAFPGRQRSSRITPDAGAAMVISIFIVSTTISVWPSVT